MVCLKQPSFNPQLCSASFLLNLLALFTFAYLVYKLKQTQRRLNDTTIELNDSKMTNLWKSSLDKQKGTPAEPSNIRQDCPSELEQARITFGKDSKPVIQPAKDQSKSDLESLMKEELELEREHSSYLEKENMKLKAKLESRSNKYTVPEIIRQKTESSQQSRESEKTIPDTQNLTNLRNQLQFCQLRLKQTELSERELKARLQDYETAAPFSLVHPEFYRLRELNQRYKEMINNLQRHLLERHSPQYIKIDQESPSSRLQ